MDPVVLIVLCGFAAVFVLFGSVFAYFWRRDVRRHRLVGQTPTTNCRDVANSIAHARERGEPVPRCEIVGTASPGDAGSTAAPFTGTPCVWFHATVSHRESRGAGESNRSVKVVDEKRSSDGPFRVRDITGAVWIDVDPGVLTEFAEKSLAETRTTDRRYLYEEWVVRDRAPMYVLGVPDLTAPDGTEAVFQNVEVVAGRTEEQTLTALHKSSRTLRWLSIGFFTGSGAILAFLIIWYALH